MKEKVQKKQKVVRYAGEWLNNTYYLLEQQEEKERLENRKDSRLNFQEDDWRY